MRFPTVALFLTAALVAACSSDDEQEKAQPATSFHIFPAKVYSGFDGQNTYRVPAIVVGNGSLPTWGIDDPSIATLVESPDGVVLTAKKAGKTKITATIGIRYAIADFEVTAYTAAAHDDGKARYTNSSSSGPACNSCHGPQKDAPDHTPTVIGQFTDEEVAKTIQTGVDPLGQPLPIEHKWGINDKEKAGLLPYLRSLDPKGFPAPGGTGGE